MPIVISGRSDASILPRAGLEAVVVDDLAAQRLEAERHVEQLVEFRPDLRVVLRPREEEEEAAAARAQDLAAHRAGRTPGLVDGVDLARGDPGTQLPLELP